MMRSKRASAIFVVLLLATLAAQPSAAEETGWWSGWSMGDPRLSQPTYTEQVYETIPITADDGVQIDAKVVRPVVEDGVRLPTIMSLSPYLPIGIPAASILPELQKHRYVERGYALVGVSIRGTGESGGCIDHQGVRDRADTDLILNTIAAQSWSNGKIGAIGLSWEGSALNAAAVTGNPHLTTIVPVAGETDKFKWSYFRGIPAWYYGYNFNMYAGPTVWHFRGMSTEHAAERHCRTTIESYVSQERTAALGMRDAWWDERDFVRLVDKIDPDLAVLQVTGFRDFGVRTDMLNEWDPLLRARLPNYRLLIGDWNHTYPDWPDIPTMNPELRFNPHPMTSWSITLLRWFDKWLKDSPTEIEAMPPALLQDTEGNWHAEGAMDPPRGVPTQMFLSPHGRLSTTAQAGEASFIDDGAGVDPRGQCVYPASGILLGCAPVHHPNAAYFVSEPYATETRLSGIAKLRLRVQHSTVRGQAGVTLYDVDGATWTPLTFSWESFNLRESDYSFTPVVPGQPFDLNFEFLARDVVLPAGHRLGMAVGSQVGANPATVAGVGYRPIPSGGVTTILLGEGSMLEWSQLPSPTPVLPIP